MTPFISISDPSWSTTFPIILTPKPEEWLPGMLLRYDEVNGWGSKTTVLHAIRGGKEKFHRSWQTESPNLIVIPPNSLKISYLAQLLGISEGQIMQTTYQLECKRLLRLERIQPKYIVTNYSFRICPECIAQDRIIRRDTALLYLYSCPKHNVIFRYKCNCGANLCLFRKGTQPYTCYICGLDWSHLPKEEPIDEIVKINKEIIDWYDFFFSREAASSFEFALYYMANRKPQRSLIKYKETTIHRSRYPSKPVVSTIVGMLVERGIYPQDLERIHVYKPPLNHFDNKYKTTERVGVS
jgi:hypothetical protein